MSKKKHSITIPSDLVEQIDEIVQDRWRGYKSRADFFGKASRRLLEEIELKRVLLEAKCLKELS